MVSTVTIFYLEMHDENELIAKTKVPELQIVEAEIKQFQVNRMLYQLVGGDYQWTDKLDYDNQQWAEYVNRDTLRTWVAYVKGSVAGYFELDFCNDGAVEVAYFGLAPGFIGRGYGGYLLSYAIEVAWSLPTTQQINVNTCSLDHSNALKNYMARGFSIVRKETKHS